MDLLEIKPHKISESLNDKIFLFYGEGGTRKTTVGAEFDKSIVGAFEIGFKFIDGVIAQPLGKWVEFKQFLRQLARKEVKEKFKTIVIDTVTLAYSACYDYVLNQHGIDDPGDLGFGKGWRLIRKEFEKAILSIPQMGYGLVLIAHSDEMEEDNVKSSKVDIDKRPAAIIKGLADFIIFLNKEVKDEKKDKEDIDKTDNTVYAYTQLIATETKTRSRYFPARFEFTYENLAEALKMAIQKQKEIEGIETVEIVENPYQEKKIDFEKLREDVAELASKLVAENSAKQKTIEAITSTLNGVRITEATRINEEQLIILKEKLLDIEEKL